MGKGQWNNAASLNIVHSKPNYSVAAQPPRRRGRSRLSAGKTGLTTARERELENNYLGHLNQGGLLSKSLDIFKTVK